jgi:predicted Zn finger-like uncharacterized protein
LFRISESQLRQARGKTRCGQCYTVFEAQEAIVDEQTAKAAPNAAPQPSLPAPAPKPPPAQKADPSMGDAASSIFNELVIKNRSVKYDIPETDDDVQPAIVPAHSGQPAGAQATASNSTSAMRRIQELKRRADENELQPQLTKQLHDQQKSTSLVSVSDRGHDLNFVPEVLQDDLYEEVHIPSAKSNFFTVLGIVGLLIMLLFQYVYFMLDTLAENPTLRPHLVYFCKVMKCEVPFRKNTKKIVAHPFVFELHPRNNRIGILRTRFKNTASHTQPFPVVEIRVKDTSRNKIQAMIRIAPKEYLPAGYNPNVGFKPGQHVELYRRFVMPTDDPRFRVSIHFR